jgi:hypothetical protein
LLFKFTALQYVMVVPFTFILLRDIYKKRFADILFLLLFCTWLFLPQLLLDDNWTASRNFTLISVLFVFYMLNRIFEFVPYPSYTIAAVAGLFFVGLMLFNCYEGWVKPQQEDYAGMKSFVDKLPPLNGQDISVVVVPPAGDLHERKSALIHYNDEFNDPVFFRIWPIEPCIRVMYKEKYPEIPYSQLNNQVKISTVTGSDKFSPEVPGKLFNLDLNN